MKKIILIAGLRAIIGVGFFLIGISHCFSAILIPNVLLAWDRSKDTNVVGYYLHYGTNSGDYTMNQDVGSQTSTGIYGLKEGTTYYFAVTASNNEHQESDFSNEVVFTVPGILQTAPRAPENNAMQIKFPVAPGHTYILQASENLLAWSNIWETVGDTNGWISFSDTDSHRFAQRFYRLLLP